MERRTAEEKCPSHHIMSEAHIMTADVDLDHGDAVVFVRFLHGKGSLLSVMTYTSLCRKVTKHHLYLTNGELRSISFGKGYVQIFVHFVIGFF